MPIAVGNIVSPRITGDPAVDPPSFQGGQTNPSLLQAQPPTFGNVMTVDEAGPIVVSVLWDNTLAATITSAAEGDTNLDRITNGDPEEVQRLLGTARNSPKWVRHKAPSGDASSDPSGGTSRSFDGRVVAVYKRTPVEDVPDPLPDPPVFPGSTFCTIKTNDGAYFEDVSSAFVVDPTR
jgi:hypothetical protein